MVTPMSDRRPEPDGGNTALNERDVSSGLLTSIPLDICLLLVVLVVSVPFVLGTIPVPGPVRLLLGLPFVMLFPGYALVTALFPRRGRTDSGHDFTALGGEAIPRRIRSLSDRGLTGIERVALGFGVSLILAPLFGLMFDIPSLELNTRLSVGIYAVFTGLASLVALVRHRNLDPADATGYTVARAISAYRRSLGRSRLDTALVLLVTVAILFAGVSGAFALTAPQDGTQFSDFVLLTQNDDGSYVAANYPDTLTQGESRTLYVGIHNNEDVATTYNVVIQLDRVRAEGNGLTVLSRHRVSSFSTTIPAGEMSYLPTQFTPSIIGENLRLTYLLYEGEVPENPTTANAYRSTYIWVNVTQSSAGAAGGA